MERFENAIFRQRVEINDRMAKIFGLLKELTTSRAPEKVLIRVGIKSPITKNVNSISLTKEEEKRNYDNDIVTGDDIKNYRSKNGDIKENEKTPFIYETPFLTTAKAVIKFDKGTITLRFGKSKISFHSIPESLCKDKKGIKNNIEPIAPAMTESETKDGAKNKTKNKPIKKAEKEEAVEVPSSQPIEYYLKHRISEKLIDGLVDNHRFNDSLSRTRVGKIKGMTYNLLPRGPVYEAILRKR
nr:hypothetical protein [Tanacetum cinerariifolium]